jgi:hypothetical protein
VELGAIVDDKGQNTRTNLERVTGTLKYMAIEVLQLGLRYAQISIEHTYRHDLESFFYVFLLICVECGWAEGEGPAYDPFQFCTVGSYCQIMDTKLAHMLPDRFNSHILEQFSPKFVGLKGLAKTLRDILFLKDEPQIGTPKKEPSVMYNNMIRAFDEAITGL